MIEYIEKVVKDLRQSKPLVLNLTNYVTMDFIANILLALGAAPIMSVCSDELEELIAISSVININIGTLDDLFITRCSAVAEYAQKYNKPIVLDPVGAGATKIRTKSAKNLAQHTSIIRGNASEIITLAGGFYNTRGVESTNTTEEAKKIAVDLASNHKCTVVVSGPVDFITDGLRQAEVLYGSSLMSLVTGMGCALSATVAAFRFVIDDPFEASVIGTHYFALCGELAAKGTRHPGSFRTAFIDNLHNADFENMRKIYVK